MAVFMTHAGSVRCSASAASLQGAAQAGLHSSAPSRIPAHLKNPEATAQNSPEKGTLPNSKPAAMASAAATVAVMPAQILPGTEAGMALVSQPITSSASSAKEDAVPAITQATSFQDAAALLMDATPSGPNTGADALFDAELAAKPLVEAVLQQQQQQQQQQQPCSKSNDSTAVPRNAAVQQGSKHTSRPATPKVTQHESSSTFDRRFALLHKGLTSGGSACSLHTPLTMTGSSMTL